MASRSSVRQAARRDSLAVDQEAIESLSLERAEPDWLRQQRLLSWASFAGGAAAEATGTRGRWVTDLTALRLERLASASAPDRSAPRGVAANQPAGGPTTSGRTLRQPFVTADSPLAGPGLVVCDLAAAAVERPDLVRAHLGSLLETETSKYTALTAALWGDGLLIYVPAGVQVEAPVRVRLRVASGEAAVFWRALVVAERGSRVTIVEDSTSSPAAAGALVSGAVEIVVGDGARVDYAAADRWGRGVSGVCSRNATVGAGAHLEWHGAHLGAELTRVATTTHLAGTGASVVSRGVFFAGERQQVDLSFQVNHRGSESRSKLDLRGAVGDAAQATLRTAVDVSGADAQVDAAVEILTLGSLARVDLAPALEVARPDAQMSQRIVVRRVPESRLRELEAEGRTRSDAVAEMLREHLSPAVSPIPDPATRRLVERTLAIKDWR